MSKIVSEVVVSVPTPTGAVRVLFTQYVKSSALAFRVESRRGKFPLFIYRQNDGRFHLSTPGAYHTCTFKTAQAAWAYGARFYWDMPEFEVVTKGGKFSKGDTVTYSNMFAPKRPVKIVSPLVKTKGNGPVYYVREGRNTWPTEPRFLRA